MRNVIYALRQAVPQETIALDAGVAADVRRVFWFDGSALIGARQVSDGPLPWRPEAAGIHLVRVVDDHGRSAERDVDIRIAR
jgi:penicillin-binding protein 1C